METIKKIASKAFAICTMDGSAHEIALRLGGTAAFVIGLIGLSFTSNDKEVEL